ncbi:MAG: TetR family transcriptional regulator [Actinomycetota bacterium]
MPVAGRRPGKRDTRAHIVAAARAAFVEEGYDRSSLRAIARRAGVDPALIHHYFDGKAALFAEVMRVGRDPREIALEVRQAGGGGAGLVRAFLELWERGRPWEGGQPPFLTTCQAVTASPQAAAGLREYLKERLEAIDPVDCAQDPADHDRRKALVTAQLLGLAWARYVVQLEPLASAPVEEVAHWIGPTLDAYMKGPSTGMNGGLPAEVKGLPAEVNGLAR